jgi:hypothetical protein
VCKRSTGRETLPGHAHSWPTYWALNVDRGGDREHLRRFGVTLYRVASPQVSEISISQTWGSWAAGAESSGGASFAHRCRAPASVVTTGLTVAPEGGEPGTFEHAASVRPFGLVSDRLMATRYPDDHDSRTGDGWKSWITDVQREADTFILDDACWTQTTLSVDDVQQQGVIARVDDMFSAAAFYLPEGRLDISIEHLKPTGPQLTVDELRIIRTADLDEVKV